MAETSDRAGSSPRRLRSGADRRSALGAGTQVTIPGRLLVKRQGCIAGFTATRAVEALLIGDARFLDTEIIWTVCASAMVYNPDDDGDQQAKKPGVRR